MANGSGMLKHGESGKGIKSRWYPKTLHDRIMAIAEHSDRFDFLLGDGIQFIVDNSKRKDAVFFIDPPYTAGGKGKRAGRRLYKHSELDHDALFDAAGSANGDFLMTYDTDPEVLSMAKARGFDTALVPMKNTHHAEMVELLIGKDLAWARAMLKPKTDYLPGLEL
jgi:DNA adenine methylase